MTYTASGDGVPGMIEMQHNMLVLKKALDYETKNQYVINVQVTDDGKPPPAMTTTIKVIVNVQGESNNLLQSISMRLSEKWITLLCFREARGFLNHCFFLRT